MIEIKNVTKCYSKNVKVIEKKKKKINDGEIFGFIGANGAGKTTTIKMITGILNITNGDIYIDGKSISKEPIEAKEKLGLVPDDPNIFLQLKGIEYLNFVADIYNVSLGVLPSEIADEQMANWQSVRCHPPCTVVLPARRLGTSMVSL